MFEFVPQYHSVIIVFVCFTHLFVDIDMEVELFWIGGGNVSGVKVGVEEVGVLPLFWK